MDYSYGSDDTNRKNEKTVSVKEVQFPEFSDNPAAQGTPPEDCPDLLMNVELDVRAELGRTTRTVSEIMKIAEGDIIVLEKSAGSPADVMANDQIIARGDIVVAEDRFGVRIKEIINRD